jgi:23S rRNA-/tRNA-specific pseudouridylate synthase
MTEPATDDLQFPLGTDVRVLTRAPGGLLAFDKPAGVLSHPNMNSEQPRALLTCDYSIAGEFFSWQDAAGTLHRIWLLNRLDSHTSGVILGVLDNGELAKAIRALFLHKHIRKVYHALVIGKPSQAKAVWSDKLDIVKKGGQVRSVAGKGIPSEAEVRVMQQRRDPDLALTLIELTPRTGRSHQLRVQCAHRKLPIVGDATYGDFKANRALAKASGVKRLCLHSHETTFDYEHAGKVVKFSAKAPTPREFLTLLGG